MSNKQGKQRQVQSSPTKTKRGKERLVCCFERLEESEREFEMETYVFFFFLGRKEKKMYCVGFQFHFVSFEFCIFEITKQNIIGSHDQNEQHDNDHIDIKRLLVILLRIPKKQKNNSTFVKPNKQKKQNEKETNCLFAFVKVGLLKKKKYFVVCFYVPAETYVLSFCFFENENSVGITEMFFVWVCVCVCVCLW